MEKGDISLLKDYRNGLIKNHCMIYMIALAIRGHLTEVQEGAI